MMQPAVHKQLVYCTSRSRSGFTAPQHTKEKTPTYVYLPILPGAFSTKNVSDSNPGITNNSNPAPPEPLAQAGLGRVAL